MVAEVSPLLGVLRLCQLVSPALPVGAYSFSQGLEYAVQSQWVHDEASCEEWLRGIAAHAIATLDVPVLLRMHAAWQAHEAATAQRWNEFLLASRETRELRYEDRQLGRALARVLGELEIAETKRYTLSREQGAGEPQPLTDPGYALMYSLACASWKIDAANSAAGYLWSWLENQVLAAVKLIPLGQSSGQRLLFRLGGEIPAWVEQARALEDSQIGIGTVSQALASIGHETQYARLFRS
jgi:urease accessory protein